MVSFTLYRARKRRAALIAAADARRRRLMYEALLTVLLIAAFVMTGYALERDEQLERQLKRGPIEHRGL